MASLAFGIGGAALGAGFGPLGASIGWTIGAALGNALFPEKIEGPRLQDLRLQVSSYGKMNPLLYATMRVAGNVIWIGNGGELVEHEETSGGKGGPEVTNYTYSASFAIRLCDVEIAGIGKVWWNGRLVRSPDATGNLPMTIYKGTETQLPDPTMEADLGVGNVPAHRGVAYVVFEDMFLTEGGNAIGNWEFEVFTDIEDIPIRVSTFDPAPDGVSGIMGATWDPETQLMTVSTWVNGASGGHPALSYSEHYFDIDGNETGSPIVDQVMVGAVSGSNICFITNANIACFPTGSGDTPPAWFVHGAQAVTIIGGGWPYGQGVIQGEFLYCASGPFPATLQRWPCLNGIPAAQPDIEISVGGTGSDYHFGTSDNGNIYVFNNASDTLVEYSPEYQVQHTWLSSDFPDDFLATAIFGFNSFVRYGDLFAFSYAGLNLDKMNLVSVAADNTLTLYPQERGGSEIPTYEYARGPVITLFGGYVLGLDGVTLLSPPVKGVPLSEIVADISDRCGLDANEIDVTDLTDIVDGYLVDQQTTGRDMIQALRDAYFFDAAEIDDKVVFVKRNADSLVSIPEDDLAAHVDGEAFPPVVGISRTQEVDLPALVTVNFVNAAADYQAGSQKAQRQVTQSQSSVSLTLPINMSEQKAKSVADTHVLLPWVERNRFSAFVSRKYAKYTPTDVVTVDGHKMRVIDANETRQGVIKLDGVAALAPVLIQAGIPVPNLTFTSVPTSPPGGGGGSGSEAVAPTLLYLLDLPLVADADDPNGLYAAMRGTGTPWSGAAVFKSSDGGSNYSSIGSSSVAAVMGTASTTLSNWTGGNIFDESNTVTVVVGSGQTLSSVSETAVLNGANEAAIGDEVIQFKNAELVDTDTYELSGLLRGRLGTEWAMDSHGASERFALLPVLRVPSPFEELYQERDYKGVTFGKTLASVASQAFTNRGRAWKPYSPQLLGGGTDGDGDVELHWTRRTRRGGGAWTSVDVPIGEEAEQYVVQIFNSDYSLCARSEFVNDVQTYTYTAADQIADFGATQQTIFFTVGQIGFANLGTQTRGTAPGAGSTNDDPIIPIAPIE